MRTLLRLMFAVIASSLSVIIAFVGLAALMNDLDNSLLFPVLYIALLLSIIGVITVGLPTHFVLRLARRQQRLFYAMPGFVVPALIVLVVHPFGEDGYPAILLQAAQMGILGALAALVFRQVAVPREAD